MKSIIKNWTVWEVKTMVNNVNQIAYHLRFNCRCYSVSHYENFNISKFVQYYATIPPLACLTSLAKMKYKT